MKKPKISPEKLVTRCTSTVAPDAATITCINPHHKQIQDINCKKGASIALARPTTVLTKKTTGPVTPMITSPCPANIE